MPHVAPGRVKCPGDAVVAKAEALRAERAACLPVELRQDAGAFNGVDPSRLAGAAGAVPADPQRGTSVRAGTRCHPRGQTIDPVARTPRRTVKCLGAYR